MLSSLKDLLFCLIGCPKMEMEGFFPFGPIPLPPYQVFYTSAFSYCSVNLKPFVPGHILVIPRRNVPTIDLLTEEEASDLMLVARKMTRFIKDYYHVNSVTIAIQDGPPAGQTIPDVHIHIMPRKFGDFEHNDDVYEMLDEADLLPHKVGGLSASVSSMHYSLRRARFGTEASQQRRNGARGKGVQANPLKLACFLEQTDQFL